MKRRDFAANVSTAIQGEQFDAVRQERDLWAKRAELLATIACAEARTVAESSNPATIETSKAHAQRPPSASIRIVA